MLTLLAPYALFGLSLLAIPIIVHLFKPRRVRETPFSSLRWLHLTQQRLARRIQWHQVLLFLLRAAFITVLVLAVARPMLSLTGSAASRERFVVLDVSRSMGYRAADRPSPLETGKEIAAQLVSAGMPDDRTAVLLTGTTTRVLGPLSREATQHLPALAAVQAGLTDTDLSSALDVVRAMLAQRRSGATIELAFITDNHLQSWTPGAIAEFLREFPSGVRAQVIDVGAASPQNAWVAEGRLASAARLQRRALQLQLGCIGDAAQQRTVRLSGLSGMTERTEAVTLSPERPTLLKFELPDAFDSRGQIARLSLEPADALPSDDELWVNLDPQGALRVLLVEGSAAERTASRPGFHLRTAVESLALAQDAPVQLTIKTAAELAPIDIDETEVILLADVPRLSEANVRALKSGVQAGRGLAVFLGPSVEPSFYNEQLVDPLRPADGLLSLPLKSIAEVPLDRGGLAPLGRVQWNHPLLAGLFDPLLGDLEQTRFRSYYQFAASPLPSDAVLAWIDDSAPAIVERPVGAGRVVLFNTTASDAWSDLPRRKSFVPLVDRLLTHLAGGSRERTFHVGDTVTLPLQSKPGETLTVVDPRGKRLTPTVQEAGGKSVLRLDAAGEPGVYLVDRASDSAPLMSFVVQVSRGDSLLTPLDSAILESWWEGADFEFNKAAAVAESLSGFGGRFSIVPWLFGLAFLLLAVETFLTNWLCPRVNPQMAASVVHRRRLLSPSGVADRG